MEMTRRKLIHKLFSAGALILMGMTRQAKKVLPRRFTWAGKYHKYPGRFKAPYGIFKKSKWSG
jgi:hypothetical protein